MVFSTILFLCVFLPIVIIGYYILPGRFKNVFLLLSSLFFYAWGEPKFIWIMLLSIACNYLLGLWLHRLAFAGRNDRQKKMVVALAVVINLGILFVFKYFTFAAASLRNLLHGDFPILEIALPIGISFYTFQGLSYIIDVYRQEGTMAENGESISIVQKNPIHLALYISMFPQLIAGPIVRYEDIRGELKERTHSAELFAAGIERFIIGLAKKAVLANVVGKLAESIFTSDYTYLGGGAAWLGAIAYTLQIYFDFSGYSDMAIGLGKIFGFHFNENFRYPYISKSIREFWRRWHISLSTWFRDYLYIPLGGNRRGNVYVNLLIVFLATGIWHGADWGFFLWGLWHGAFMLAERVYSSHKAKVNETEADETKADTQINRAAVRPAWASGLVALTGWVYTMLVVVVGWVLFRIVDVPETLRYLGIMFGIHRNEFVAYGIRYYLTNRNVFFTVLACVCALPVIPWIKEHMKKETMAVLIIKRILLLALLIISFLFIINSSYNPFIYFRF